ncbi:hypothetical protein PNOK_0837800 [Pyrrhoderma noxium]|uniref:DUF6534 domain-containing protein n=1 Tax=Pyrrhoderma noxium TaxID=2282107 RepID=A0A286UB10_9AGAM|nr:hypothetical protein PNOK_0837800 [Pyrrhoderma noxium]
MALTEEEWQQVLWLLGPWIIGGFLDVLLQGVLFCQFVNYYTYYYDDKHGLRWLVVGLLVMTTLKSAQSFLLVWEQSIVHFSSVEDAVLLSYTKWWQIGNSLMVATIGAYVQSFFLYRLYSLSRAWYSILPIGVVLVFGYISVILATYYTAVSEFRKIGYWFAAHLGSIFAGDTLLSCATAYALLRATNKHGLKQTNDLINALVRLTFQTAAPAAICAMFNLIFSQVYKGEDRLVSAAFNMPLPKLYAISMMWTLNARRTIRTVHSSGGHMTSSTELSGRTRRREDLELGRLGTIQIRTEIETSRHIDSERRIEFGDTKDRHGFDEHESNNDIPYKATAV